MSKRFIGGAWHLILKPKEKPKKKKKGCGGCGVCAKCMKSQAAVEAKYFD